MRGDAALGHAVPKQRVARIQRERFGEAVERAERIASEQKLHSYATGTGRTELLPTDNDFPANYTTVLYQSLILLLVRSTDIVEQLVLPADRIVRQSERTGGGHSARAARRFIPVARRPAAAAAAAFCALFAGGARRTPCTRNDKIKMTIVHAHKQAAVEYSTIQYSTEEGAVASGGGGGGRRGGGRPDLRVREFVLAQRLPEVEAREMVFAHLRVQNAHVVVEHHRTRVACAAMECKCIRLTTGTSLWTLEHKSNQNIKSNGNI